MRTYKIVKRKVFESEDKFEARLNELSSLGWKAISITLNGGLLTVLMEKER